MNKSKTRPKEKRYCKGCFADVTDHMFCYCGEMALTLGSTYSESEMNEMQCGEITKGCPNQNKHKEKK